MQEKKGPSCNLDTPNPEKIFDFEPEAGYLKVVSILRQFLKIDTSQIQTFEDLSSHTQLLGNCIEKIIKLCKTMNQDSYAENEVRYVYNLQKVFKEKSDENSEKRLIIARQQRDGTITVHIFINDDLVYWVKIPSQPVNWTKLPEINKNKICACHQVNLYSPNSYLDDIQGFVCVLKNCIQDLLFVIPHDIPQRKKRISDQFWDKKPPNLRYQ